MTTSQIRFTVLTLLALAFFPLVASNFGLDLVSKIMIYAILALSLELLVGTTGLVCFGQAAFFGIGAYSAVMLTPQSSPVSLFWLLPASILAASLFALVVGALSLRTKGVYFIMVTLAFAQMAYYVVHDTPFGGGTDGIYLNQTPTALAGIDLAKPGQQYALILTSLALVLGLLTLVQRSRFGRALAGIRVNEQRMRATGFSTYPYKLAAFVLSGGLAGFAGFLFALKDGYVNPEMMSWHLSGAVLIMIILGGLGHLHGALIGAFSFTLLQELFKSEAIFGDFSKHWHLGLGLAIIASVALLPRGLVGIPRQIRERLMGKDDELAEADAETHHGKK
jgi:branched-chain amino acid transport system permease protein